MTRVRISTTVDRELLDEARRSGHDKNDAELVDAALSALLASRRRAVVDEEYDDAYGRHPIEEPDEWGDLASFRQAAAAS